MSQVQVTFLGSGDAFGSGGRFQTCLHLRGAGGDLLIDYGASSLVAMKRSGVDPSEIGWILLSHLHGDHFGGIPFLILDGQFSGRTDPLVIAGPPGTGDRVNSAMEVFFPGSSRMECRFSVEFIDLVERVPTEVGPGMVTPFLVHHPSGAPSYALRVQYGGNVISYSGDTEWTESLVDAARGADIFICEASFYAKRVRYHLDYQTLLAYRPRLECRRLIMTHMSEDMLSRLDTLEIEAAKDGQTIVL